VEGSALGAPRPYKVGNIAPAPVTLALVLTGVPAESRPAASTATDRGGW